MQLLARLYVNGFDIYKRNYLNSEALFYFQIRIYTIILL